MKSLAPLVLGACLAGARAAMWIPRAASAHGRGPEAWVRMPLWASDAAHRSASSAQPWSGEPGRVRGVEVLALSLRKQGFQAASVCTLLCLLLCFSCCCLSGGCGVPGLGCGTLLPLAVLVYVALGTSLLQTFLRGEPVGFWCALVVAWSLAALVAGGCLTALACCGVLTTGAMVAAASSKVSGLRLRLSAAGAPEQTVPLPGCPARQV
mmetsp:Transcript_26393/g.82996  ORF Transcript_26393/g.82996 Transcript_26393/m.82996 type:complete len:209 (-) Transcript_26393:38-664(-)